MTHQCLLRANEIVKEIESLEAMRKSLIHENDIITPYSNSEMLITFINKSYKNVPSEVKEGLILNALAAIRTTLDSDIDILRDEFDKL